MKKIYFPFLVVTILIAGCKSATKLYQKGNYDDAVEVAAKKLQKDPNDADLKKVIQDSYRYAVTDHQNQIKTYTQSNDELKSDWIYNEYAALQNLYNVIFRTPSVFDLVHPTDYSSQLIAYGKKAADVHYNRGVGYMNNNDRQSFKSAYHEFQTALSFDAGNATIQNALDDAYQAALVKVVVIPTNDYGFTYSSYNYQLQNFETEITRNLESNSGNEFVKFFSPLDAQRLNIVPDQVVETHFTQLTIGKINDKSSVRELSKDVVTKEIVYRPDSVVKQYSKVKARITTTSRIMMSEGDLNMVIRDNMGKILWTDNITSSSGWSTQFNTFTGDERALGDDDKKILNKPKDTPPREEETINCIKESVYNDFIARLRNYYSRY
jgi:hypothetical protein